MKIFRNSIHFLFIETVKWFNHFLGGCDGLLYALLIFIIINYITNVMCAITDHSFSNEIGFKGICHKILIFFLVGIANVIDVHIIKSDSVIRTAIIFFYISNEGLSLLDNVTHLGLPVPENLKIILKQLHDHPENEEK